MDGEIIPPNKPGTAPVPVKPAKVPTLAKKLGKAVAIRDEQDEPGDPLPGMLPPPPPEPPIANSAVVANSATIAKSYVERMAQLLSEQQELADTVNDLKAEIKSAGLIPKAIVIIAKRQLESAEKRAEREALEQEVDQLMVALGMLADTPLGEAARSN